MKKLVSLLLSAIMIVSVMVFSVPTSSATGDPADSYAVQTAPYEDADIQMWFSHANVKVHQEDTTSTGRNTYSVYMAKNEYQGTQVTLYSPSVTKTDISANVTDFTAMDGSGATMSADVYYEFYINCVDLDSTDVLGIDNAEDSFIREGMIPDAMAKIEEINNKRSKDPVTGATVTRTGDFTLTAGLTQTLYIKIKSELDTPSGWYSGQFNVTDYDGNVIKTATVYAYVWNFEIPEANHYQTSMFLSYGALAGISDELYKNYYDYLLDNRLCAMDLPGELNSSNEYITNPRVTSFRITKKGTYIGALYNTDELSALYADLSTLPDWQNIKNKIYFYVMDEPRSQQQKDAVPSLGNGTVAQIPGLYNTINNGWEDPYVMVVIDENHPYPAGYSKTVAWDGTKYLTEDDGSGRFDAYDDAIQGIMDQESVTLWCMKSDVFTPHEVIEAVGYTGARRATKVKNMNGIISGFDCTNVAAYYFDWDSKYGPFSDRFEAFRITEAAKGIDIKLWWYECGKGPDYTYCNHLIENTGLQTELLFWQSMQVGSTGYLYYGTNTWNEFNSDTAKAVGSSVYYDGSTVSGKWEPNRHENGDAPGTYIYGNGNLFYGTAMRTYLRTTNNKAALGTVRVENMRDGIEDYEMLYMYREAYGEAAMQTFIEKVSNNVVDYLSMPSFDRSGYAATMTSEDIFASVRIELGNAVEAAQGEPAHDHVWDGGVVTKEPTYTETGIMTYTCSGCGETREEEIPVIPPLIGDVNGDYMITVKDLQAIKKLLAGGLALGEYVEGNCDVSGDDMLTIKDVTQIKKLLA